MKLDEFNKDTSERLQKKADLKAEIETDKKELIKQKEAYEQAIIDNKDKEADEIFPLIERLKNSINSKEYRLASIEKITHKQIQENAYSTVLEIKQLEQNVQHQLDELDKEMIPLVQKQAELFERANKIKSEYKTDKQAYERLITAYNLERKELNDKGFYKNRKDPAMFRESKAGAPVQNVRASEPNTRKERLKSLPANATLKEIAEASRIIQS